MQKEQTPSPFPHIHRQKEEGEEEKKKEKIYPDSNLRTPKLLLWSIYGTTWTQLLLA